MSKTHKVQVNVGSLTEMGKRFTSTWNRAVAGEQVDETHVTFLNAQTMLNTLSPRGLNCCVMFVSMGLTMSESWRRRWREITKMCIRMLQSWRQRAC